MVISADTSLHSLHKRLVEELRLVNNGSAETTQLALQFDATTRQLSLVQNSLSWRLTKPLRGVNSALIKMGLPTRGLRNLSAAFISKLKRDGIVAALSKTYAYLGMRYTSKIRKTSIVNPAQACEEPESHPKANSLFGNNVTLICESTLPQCFKYRVAQKADMLRMLGMTVDIIDWRQTANCLSSLQISAMAIFYRVPFYPSVQRIYTEVKRLDIPTFWEVDDLIFDAELYKSNTNMQALPVEIVKGLLEGAELYGRCLSASDFGIASTEKLQEIMSREKTTWVVENALDKQTVEIAKGLRREKKLAKPTKNTVDIMYGSGTKTHDIDFKEAEPAIISVLAKRANARFIVMGDLTVSKELETSSQFVRYPAADFKSYLRKLSMADISIAPLEASEFNEAKSNIKYLEASVLGLASVCTPTSPFENAIQHGENGYLARTFEEWEGSLLELVDNEEKRIEVARNAYKFVYRNYSPFRIARRQLLPAVSHLLVEKKKKRILSANIYFYPKSFGGATIIAEQMISRLSNDEGVEHFVLTIDQEIDGPDYSLKRYKALGAEVIAIKTPIYRSNVDMLYDRKLLKIFRNILEATDPDLVHLHSIQGLGLALPEACRETGVPYTITVHDTWWLCGRQFMVNDRNEFCQQRRLDPVICSVCVSDAKFEIYRREMSRLALNNAIRILAPSQYIRDIYIANGVDSEKITLNKNGVREPNRNLNSDPRPLTFGYVGGKTEIKGWDMVVKAFNELSSAYDIRLAVVDNALNLGYRSIDKSEFISHDKVDVVPAYKQETIDDFFSTIDVLLFPTQAMESFGLTVREAQIRGKWVITTEAGGAIEDINDGVNGTVIPMAKNPKYLIEAMKEIIEEFSTKPPLVNPHIVTFAEQAEDLRLQYGELIR